MHFFQLWNLISLLFYWGKNSSSAAMQTPEAQPAYLKGYQGTGLETEGASMGHLIYKTTYW